MLLAHVLPDNFQRAYRQRRLFFKVTVERRELNRVNFRRYLRDRVENVRRIFLVQRQFADYAALRRQPQRKYPPALSVLHDKNLPRADEIKIFGVVALVKKIFARLQRNDFARNFVIRRNSVTIITYTQKNFFILKSRRVITWLRKIF